MTPRRIVKANRTLRYHTSLRVFPPVPRSLQETVRQVIRLAQAGDDGVTVNWYGRPKSVRQVVAECRLAEFVTRSVWVPDTGVISRDGAIWADFVLPKPDGSLFDEWP